MLTAESSAFGGSPPNAMAITVSTTKPMPVMALQLRRGTALRIRQSYDAVRSVRVLWC
jgi:hypothetical protein